MATQYIKYAKKCLKKIFSQIIGKAMAPFGQGVATPMIMTLLYENLSGHWSFEYFVKTKDSGA